MRFSYKRLNLRKFNFVSRCNTFVIFIFCILDYSWLSSYIQGSKEESLEYYVNVLHYK